jgi:hypothetical protein
MLKLLAMGDADLSIDEESIAVAEPLEIGAYNIMITAVNKMLVIVITVFNIYTEKIYYLQRFLIYNRNKDL